MWCALSGEGVLRSGFVIDSISLAHSMNVIQVRDPTTKHRVGFDIHVLGSSKGTLRKSFCVTTLCFVLVGEVCLLYAMRALRHD